MKNDKPRQINAERLWQSLMDMAQIGATAKGGSCRLALTDEDKAGRDLFVRWCTEAVSYTHLTLPTNREV